MWQVILASVNALQMQLLPITTITRSIQHPPSSACEPFTFSCKTEIVSTKINRRHQAVLEGIVVIVSRQIKLIEASVAGRKASLTGVPVAKRLAYASMYVMKEFDLLVNAEQGVALHTFKVFETIERDLARSCDELQ